MKQNRGQQSWIALGLVSLLVACSTLPTVTRTGEVKNVLIREELSPEDLSVRPGDEIRWVNGRQGNVRVIFLNPIDDKMSCKEKFSGSEAKLKPHQSASVCFAKEGFYRYTVRMDTALPVGELNASGVVRVMERVPESEIRGSAAKE